MSAGSPTQVKPGAVVRIRMGSHVYTSVRMTLDEARTVFGDVKKALRQRSSDLVDLPEFPDDTAEELALHYDRVISIEVRRVTITGAHMPSTHTGGEAAGGVP